jgi:hypothetical protein
MYASITLEDGRTATFDYDILTNQYVHTIEDDWNTTTVNPKNNPLKDMLLSVFDDSAHFENNRKRTKITMSIKRNLLLKL